MCALYSALNGNATDTITEALANAHPEEKLSLSDRFLKAMDASTKALFTEEEQLSGYYIFKSIEDSNSTQKSDADIELLYIQYTSIKRNINNSTRAFTAHIKTDAAKFYRTEYEVNPKSLARMRRKGIGSDFHSINKMVDETGIIPDGRSKKLPLRQLVDKAGSYLCARGVKNDDEKKKQEKKQEGRKPRQNEKNKDPDLQGDVRKKRPQDGPPQVIQQQPDPEVENWKKHVKRHIFQHICVTDQNLEASSQLSGKFPSGCYYFWMENHNHQQCGKLKYLKSKAQIECDQQQLGG